MLPEIPPNSRMNRFLRVFWRPRRQGERRATLGQRGPCSYRRIGLGYWPKRRWGACGGGRFAVGKVKADEPVG